jgi:hypothetical protein
MLDEYVHVASADVEVVVGIERRGVIAEADGPATPADRPGIVEVPHRADRAPRAAGVGRKGEGGRGAEREGGRLERDGPVERRQRRKVSGAGDEMLRVADADRAENARAALHERRNQL